MFVDAPKGCSLKCSGEADVSDYSYAAELVKTNAGDFGRWGSGFIEIRGSHHGLSITPRKCWMHLEFGQQ